MRTTALVTRVALLGIAATTAAAEARDLRVGTDAPTIQAAIDAAASGDRVVVPAGVYRESIDLKGRAITLFGEAGAANTFLDGSSTLTGPVVTIESGEGRDTIIQGLTVRGAWDDGVRVTNASPTIRDCVVAWNGRRGWSAGISLRSSGARIERCAIVGNAGGGVLAAGSGLEIVGNEIRGNSVDSDDGGGLFVQIDSDGSALVERNVIQGNSAGRYGGGLAVSGPATIVGNVVVGNTATWGGSGVYWRVGEGPAAHLTANTIAADDPSGGAALYLSLSGPSTADVRVEGNVVATANGAPAVHFDAFNLYGMPPPTYAFARNDLWAGGASVWRGSAADPTGVDGNVSVDPRFVAPAAADLRLAAGSPCIDAGGATAPGLPSTDMFGAPRSLDGDGDGSAVPDMGAFEFTGAPHVAAVRLDHDALDVPEDGGPLTLTVRRDGGDLPAATVHVRAAMLGATIGSDPGPFDVVATFAAGRTTADVVVPIADDGICTPAEFLAVSIDRPDAGCVVGLYGAAVLRVVDAPALVANYFPMPAGTRSYYRQNNGAVTHTEVLPGHPRVEGVATTVLLNTADHSRMYMTVDDLGLRLHRISISGVPFGSYGRRNVSITFRPPLELAKARVSMIDPASPTFSQTGGSAVLVVSGLLRRNTDCSATFKARRGDVTAVDGISAPFDALVVEGAILLSDSAIHLSYTFGPGLGIVRNDDPDTGDSAVLTDTTLGRHALSIDAVGVPRPRRLGKKAVKARVDVIVRNRGGRDEVIEDAAMLDAFVSTDAASLGGAAAPTVARVGRPKFPLVVRAGKVVHFRYDVTMAAANDPARGAGHEDFRVTATVTPAALDRFTRSPLLPPVAAPINAGALLDLFVK